MCTTSGIYYIDIIIYLLQQQFSLKLDTRGEIFQNLNGALGMGLIFSKYDCFNSELVRKLGKFQAKDITNVLDFFKQKVNFYLCNVSLQMMFK